MGGGVHWGRADGWGGGGVHWGRADGGQHCGGGGCGWRGGGEYLAARGPYDLNDVKGVAIVCVCVCVGGGGGGLTRGQLLRSALHAISVSLQNSFCWSYTWRLVSEKAQRKLNSHWVLPVYPIWRTKVKWVGKIIGQAKKTKQD